MAPKLEIAAICAGLSKIADHLIVCRDELNAADALLGDGDIGVAISEGFGEVKTELEALPADLGMALMKCAQALTRRGGSSYATILATALMGAATVLKGQTAADWAILEQAFQAAIDKTSARARSSLGDKTVLDSLESVRQALVGVQDPQIMTAKAIEAARGALEEYRDKPCRQGRARIFAAKSRGLDDPGMLAFARMIEALA